MWRSRQQVDAGDLHVPRLSTSLVTAHALGYFPDQLLAQRIEFFKVARTVRHPNW